MRDFSTSFAASDVCIRFRNRHQMSISDIYFGFKSISESELFGGELDGGIGGLGGGIAGGVGGFFLPPDLDFAFGFVIPRFPLSRRLNDHSRAAASGGLAARAPAARDYGAREASRLRLQAGTVQARFAR
ncbi:MAG: hypothetical protein WAX67_01020, partial [Rugosibacter sp.]